MYGVFFFSKYYQMRDIQWHLLSFFKKIFENKFDINIIRTSKDLLKSNELTKKFEIKYVPREKVYFNWIFEA